MRAAVLRVQVAAGFTRDCHGVETRRGVVRQNLFPTCTPCDLFYLEPDSGFSETPLRASPLTEIRLSSYLNEHVQVTGGRAMCGPCDVFGVTIIERLAPTDVHGETDRDVPAAPSLAQNYPNPFNPATIIPYSLRHDGFVRLKIVGVLGQDIVTLVSGFQRSGLYQVRWDATGCPGGVYLYWLAVSGESGRTYTRAKAMMLLK